MVCVFLPMTNPLEAKEQRVLQHTYICLYAEKARELVLITKASPRHSTHALH
jgi:hypothetical protein